MNNIKINYVIATWSGNRLKNVNRIYYENVLKNHIKTLQNTKNSVSQITVMKPINNFKNNYYNIEKLPNLVINECENKFFSYGQWLKAAEIYLNKFDYFIFIEDDYVPGCDYFDEKLIDLYVENSYLCSKADKLREQLFHCAISNGIISNNTIKRVLEKERFVNWFSRNNIRNYQVAFSRYLHDNGVSLKDYSKEYMTTFHEKDFKITDYSNVNVKNKYEIFTPIQKIYDARNR